MNEIGVHLKKIHILLERKRNYEYREYNLTSTQLDIMEYLYFSPAGKNTLCDIASFFGVQHTSVIHVLKILEKKELICRREASGCARSKPILLTQNGRAIMENHLTHSADHDALLFAGIPQQDLEVLERSLRQIYQNLQQDMCGVSRENI
jgi:Transcriptional regulators